MYYLSAYSLSIVSQKIGMSSGKSAVAKERPQEIVPVSEKLGYLLIKAIQKLIKLTADYFFNMCKFSLAQFCKLNPWQTSHLVDIKLHIKQA